MMTSFKFKSDDWDVEILDDLGYLDDLRGVAQPINVDDDGSFEAIKLIKDKQIAITIWHVKENQGYAQGILVYRYKGDPHCHTMVEKLSVKQALPYVQELIDEDIIYVKF